MSVRKQSRKWNLTINEPLEKGWSHEKLNNTLQNIASMVYYCYADEIGMQETYHTHVYIVTKNPKPFTTIKNFFPEAHIESPDGSSKHNRDYIFKEGDKFNKNPDTGEYDYTDSQGKKHIGTHYDDTNFEWGELPVERPGSRTDIADLYEMIKDGLSNVEIMEINPKYMMHLDKIERARQNYRDSIYSSDRRDVEVTYIWGPSGSGKTRYVVQKYGYENVYRVTDYRNPFDSYVGQDVVLFEEFRSSVTFSDILNWTDIHPTQLRARYVNKVACYTKVYFCSNIDLREQYRNIQMEEPESWDAFLRRIKNVCIMINGQPSTFPTELYMQDKFYFLEGRSPFDYEPDYEQIGLSFEEDHENG